MSVVQTSGVGKTLVMGAPAKESERRMLAVTPSDFTDMVNFYWFNYPTTESMTVRSCSVRKGKRGVG